MEEETRSDHEKPFGFFSIGGKMTMKDRLFVTLYEADFWLYNDNKSEDSAARCNPAEAPEMTGATWATQPQHHMWKYKGYTEDSAPDQRRMDTGGHANELHVSLNLFKLVFLEQWQPCLMASWQTFAPYV